MKYPCKNSCSKSDQADISAAAPGHVDAQRPMAGARESSPRTVIRGESFQDTSNPDPLPNCGDIQPLASAHPYAAHTDWLNCTIPVGNDPDFLQVFIHQFLAIVGAEFAPVEELGRGLHGWKRSFQFSKTGAKLAMGGQNDTLFLSLPGEACTLISLDTWPPLKIFLEEHYNARITRWDGAVDDFEGIHSIDWAVEQYRANQFNAGGTKPSCNTHGNWLNPDAGGRTLYIGKRKNGKLLRIYEKGKQLGDLASFWVRWELELHNRDRVIPWEVLIYPGQYVAGAYPGTNWVSSETSRIKTIQKSAKIGYNALTYFAKQAYGPLLNVMMEHEGSPAKVVAMLIRDGKPARLQLPIPPEMSGPILAKDEQ